MISIVSPYKTADVEICQECNLSGIDEVERSGFVSPDKKIQEYIRSGMVLQSIRTGGEEFDVQGGETDAEPNSPEFYDELTADAENYDGSPMPQFIDKISALETVDNAEKTFTANEAERNSETSKRKSEADKQKKYIDEMTTSLASKINKGEKPGV